MLSFDISEEAGFIMLRFITKLVLPCLFCPFTMHDKTEGGYSSCSACGHITARSHAFEPLILFRLILFLIFGPYIGLWRDCWISVEFFCVPIARKWSGSTTATWRLTRRLTIKTMWCLEFVAILSAQLLRKSRTQKGKEARCGKWRGKLMCVYYWPGSFRVIGAFCFE